MPQKYYNSKEAAAMLGVPDTEVRLMIDRRELHGYRDGADWKFKAEDIDRLVRERATVPPDDDEDGDVLLSEVELGHSDPGLSGTVIGAEKGGKSAADSDIKLADSAVGFAESDINLGEEPKPSAKKKDDVSAKVSQFEEIDLTLDHDLTIEESAVGAQGKAAPGKPMAGDSAVDLSGKKLEDDDVVLGSGGPGSDISIGGDSGISLVDPADSGISLESPLNLSTASEESLELGEDDLLSFSTDADAGGGMKSEDDFQLTPADEGGDSDESESGSQVIALDTESEGDEAATMVAGAGAVAAMLDEDGGMGGGLGMPAEATPLGEAGFGAPADGLAMGGQFVPAMALPEAPYTILNIVSLVLCSFVLIFVGMMMYDLLRNMWSWDTAHPVNNALMDAILGLFEK
jgi:excisionase family DNA binding protein